MTQLPSYRGSGMTPTTDVDEPWSGDITRQRTAELRDSLYRRILAPGNESVRLDVRDVTSIERAGIALLIGARRRALAAGRALVLIDNHGAVTAALLGAHVLQDFLIEQVDQRDPSEGGPA